MANLLRGAAPRVGAPLMTWLAGSPAETKANGGPIQLDRARRLHTTHQRGPGRRCGLCLQAWPCPERSWADRTLRGADPTAPRSSWAGSRWNLARWSHPLRGAWR
jgi:hypothetical protein